MRGRDSIGSMHMLPLRRNVLHCSIAQGCKLRKIRAAAVAAPLLEAGCGPQHALESRRPIAECGPPDPAKFHGARAVLTAANGISPEIYRHWVDGCAIISFELDANGKIVNQAIVLERPAAQGVGVLAIAVLVPNVYAANSERGFENQAPTGPHQRYAMTVGFWHDNGRVVVVKRTVIKEQVIHI